MSEPYDIDYLLDEVITLPSLPSVVAKITQIVNNPDCSMAEVGKAISSDPAIALKTLRLVNSAYYGLGHKVSSVEQAVVLLGVKVIKNLVVTATVFEGMRSSAEVYLRHSVGCGVAMKTLIECGVSGTHTESNDEAFIYGLLHDIGKVILKEFLPDELEKSLKLSRSLGVPWHVAERRVIGADHAEIGARLAEKWKLPETIVSAISGHHDLDSCIDQELRGLAATLGLADYICTECSITPEPGLADAWDQNMWSELGIQSKDVAPMMDSFFNALPQIEEMIAITK